MAKRPAPAAQAAPAENDKTLPPGHITMENASRLLMISTERIRQLIKQGYVPRAPQKGIVSIQGAVQGYINFLKEDQRRASKSAADSRVRDARAQEIELRIAKEARQLIQLDEACNVLDFVFGQLKAELIGIPARVTRDLALRRTIENELDGALERAVGNISEAQHALRAGGDPTETIDQANA